MNYKIDWRPKIILIDSRVGSKDLLPLLGRDALLTTLEFADCMFVGGGEGDMPIFVGIEIKTIKDALSCIMNGRFAGHQLPGLVKEYDVVYLLLEGLYKADGEGMLQVPAGRGWRAVRLGHRSFMWRDFESWLTSMENMGNVRVRRARDRKETVGLIRCLHKWWTRKDWGEHKAHLVPNKAHSVLGVKYSLKRRIAAQLEGVGETRSGEVARHFPDIGAMLAAGVEEWQEVKGIGKVTAEKVVKELSQ